MAAIIAQQTFDSTQAPAIAAGAANVMSPQELLLQTGLAYIGSACLNTAVRLRIPDLIGGDAKDVDKLAHSDRVPAATAFSGLRTGKDHPNEIAAVSARSAADVSATGSQVLNEPISPSITRL